MSERIIKWFAEAYCRGHNLILISIYEKIVKKTTSDGYEFNDSYYVMDCMNDENKFLKFKITKTVKSINNELCCEVKAIRI